MNQRIWVFSTILIASHLMGNGQKRLITFYNYAPNNISITISPLSPASEAIDFDLPEGSYALALNNDQSYILKAKWIANQRETPITVRPNTITISGQQLEYTITYNRNANGKLELLPGHIKK